jgi:hypothetical protein
MKTGSVAQRQTFAILLVQHRARMVVRQSQSQHVVKAENWGSDYQSDITNLGQIVGLATH